jgi:hypothetical protein
VPGYGVHSWPPTPRLGGPYTVALTAILTAVSGQLWARPWVLSALAVRQVTILQLLAEATRPA